MALDDYNRRVLGPAVDILVRERRLARLFADVWGAYLVAVGFDFLHHEELLARTGLVVWRPATEADIATRPWEVEVGDPLLCLTEEGKRIVREGQEKSPDP